MLGRVKESVFNILGDEVVDAVVLDLFSGSGALGLEALSRGAVKVRFVEESKEARKALRRNCEAFGLGPDEVEHRPGDALVAEAWREPGQGRWADLAFLDPPYPIWRAPGDRRTMLAVVRSVLTECLKPGAPMVLHVPPGALSAVDLRLDAEAKPRRYGQSEIWVLRGPDDPAPAGAPEGPQAAG